MPSIVFLLAACVAAVRPLQATELQGATAEAFQRYVRLTETRIESEVADPKRFLYLDSLPEKHKQAMLSSLHGGWVFTERMRTREDGKEIEVPDGMVHHWMAIGFLPRATLQQVVGLAEDYSRHVEIYAPDIQKAEVLSHTAGHDIVAFRFYRQSIVTIAYNTEFKVDYFFLGSSGVCSFSRSVKIAELENPGKADEKELPVGNDHGYMWRLNLYTRYLERDNGVYLQIEFLALSRSVPAIFAWIVNPYIRSVPRDYLTHYIGATRKALKARAAGMACGTIASMRFKTRRARQFDGFPRFRRCAGVGFRVSPGAWRGPHRSHECRGSEMA